MEERIINQMEKDILKARQLLNGSTINNFYVDHELCEGGMVFEITTLGLKKIRIVFGYTELGEWVEVLEEMK